MAASSVGVGGGGVIEVALDRGDGLGEVVVADNAPELSLGFEHPGDHWREILAAKTVLGAGAPRPVLQCGPTGRRSPGALEARWLAARVIGR